MAIEPLNLPMAIAAIQPLIGSVMLDWSQCCAFGIAMLKQHTHKHKHTQNTQMNHTIQWN